MEVKGMLSTQDTARETSIPFTKPLPLPTVHVWFGLLGCVNTETLYAVPSAMVLLKVNRPSAAIFRLSMPLFSNTKPLPFRPVTLTLMAYGWETQLTATLPISWPCNVPLPLLTVQVWFGGALGCVAMVTS